MAFGDGRLGLLAPWPSGSCERERCEIRRKKEEKEGPRERARGRPGAAPAAGSRRAAGLRCVRREDLVREGPGDAVAGDGGGAARGRTSRGGEKRGGEQSRCGWWIRRGWIPRKRIGGGWLARR